MAIVKNIFNFGNIAGSYRNFLLTRTILPTYQPIATLIQSTEEKLGLPVKPKRPKTAYLRFLDQIRPSMRKKHPDLKTVDIMRIMGLEWQKADQSMKQKLEEEYRISYEEYRKAQMSYLDSITDEQKKLIEDANIKKEILKKTRLLKQANKALGKPKRPGSAFAFYTRAVGTKRGALSPAEWVKLMKAQWEALPPNEKELYEIEVSKAKEEYKKNIKLWKAKIAKLDNENFMKLEESKKSTE